MISPTLNSLIVGNYELHERIGRGGMAVVYRAVQRSGSRVVALKLLDLELLEEEREEFSQRFAREAALIAQLEHLHIVPVYAYGVEDERCAYLAQRLMTGGTAADLLRARPLPLAYGSQIFVQSARGLGYAHAQGVIHRDIKPSNVLLDDAGNACLSDFGLATFTERAPRLTRTNALVGTPTYLAPECVQGQTASVRSDVYAMGVLLFHLLSGAPPFSQGDSGVIGLLQKHVQEPPPPLRERVPEAPAALEEAVQRALHKDPGQRFADANELADAVEAALERMARSFPVSQPRRLNLPDVGRPAFLARLRLRRRMLAGIGAVMLALLLVLGYGELFSGPRIVLGASGTIDQVTLNGSELVRARVRLGLSRGFIAYIMCNGGELSQLMRMREISDMAAQDGLPLRYYDGESSVEIQYQEFERALDEGAGAVILCPLDTPALRPLIDRVALANMPLAYVTASPVRYGTKLEPQNYEIGYALGQTAAEYLNRERSGTGSVLALAPAAFTSAVRRIEAMRTAVARIAPGAIWLGSQDVFDSEQARSVVAELLAGGMQPEVIIANSDAIAYGAIDALQAAAVPTDAVIVLGVNGEPRALDEIRNGHYMYATIGVSREEGSVLIYRSIVRQLAGSAVPEVMQVRPSGLITREQLDSAAPAT